MSAMPLEATTGRERFLEAVVRSLADLGWSKALERDAGFAAGLNVHEGAITHEAVARDLGMDYRPIAN